jgi:predicted DNA-binding protein YlxM (UPF0122 family)
MENYIFHPSTANHIQSYLKDPGHALAIIGPLGIGKKTLAQYITVQLLAIDEQQLQTYPYYKHIAPEKNVITIETARQLLEFMKLRTTGTQSIRRIVLIEDAHTLTLEAQNALLKVIEEPPKDSVILLTIKSKGAILPTITSRLQAITVRSPMKDVVVQYFTDAGYDKHTVMQCYAMSGGYVGLTHELLEDNENHTLVKAVELAKRILTLDHFERLLLIDDIAKQQQMDNLLFALGQIARGALTVGVSRDASYDTLKRWGAILTEVEQAKQLLASNTQVKLIFTNLLLRI